MQQHRTLLEAIYRLYEHSGFSLAGSVAFSFVLSLFPFCIFLASLAGLIFGGHEIADRAVANLFEMLPEQVAKALAPEVEAVMGNSPSGLLTLSAALALFFATSGVETLRAALNGAYRATETRPYPLSLLVSMLFVIGAAASMLVLTWSLVVGPAVAARLEPSWLKIQPSFWQVVLETTQIAAWARYLGAAIVMFVLLLAVHMWLAAGRRSFRDVWPGITLTVVLWLITVALYSTYLGLSNYSRFYAGLSHIRVALIFFQFTAILIILGAELNRGIMELKKMQVRK